MKSIGTSIYTTTAAIKAADRIFGPNRVWIPTSEAQATYINTTYAACAPELPNIPQIDSNATTDPENHKAFMTKHGWKSLLTDVKPGDVLTAGVLDLLVHWVEKGRKMPLKVKDVGTFPGVMLETGVSYHRNADGEPAVCIETKTGDKVWIALSVTVPSTTLEVARATDKAFGQMKPAYGDFDKLFFPMIDLKSQQSLDWVVGLKTKTEKNGGFMIAQAMQQATLKMNDEGARARAADEMRMVATAVPRPKPNFVVDRPFLVAFKRPGLARSLWEGYVDYESWKDPGGLNV